jgi:hypothetical protein
MKAMVPSNIVSGFRKCGVYPFNPDAIVIDTSDGDHENATSGEATDTAEEGLSGAEHSSVGEDDIDFTLEEYRFERRYEEGYDLHDPRYFVWLEHCH